MPHNSIPIEDHDADGKIEVRSGTDNDQLVIVSQHEESQITLGWSFDDHRGTVEMEIMAVETVVFSTNSGMDNVGLPVSDVPHTLTGNFRIHKKFRSKFLEHDRDVIVYLPPGYDADQRRRYPVLYMHDGQNLFDGATSYIPGQEWCIDETAEALITSHAIEPLIIVGIYNTGEQRADEYTPTKDQHLNIGGKADLYGRLIIEELKPLIDAHYRTLKGAANTGLGGSSLGGLVSLYLGFKYPQFFGKLAVISPAVWWDQMIIVQFVKALKSKPKQRIWLDMGTNEGGNAIEHTALLRDALVAQGWILNADLMYLEAEGAHHNEQAWAQRVDPILRYLFPSR